MSMIFLMCGIILIFIEGVTELLHNPESIVYKIIYPRLPAFYKEAFNCGFCLSLQVSILINIIWLNTQLWYLYPIFVIVTWRLSNFYHTFYSWLMRLKMFTGGKVG